MSKNTTWAEDFAEKIYRKFGDYAIPFTTPFFAIYNCYKLMKVVDNKHLKLMIFIITIIYVITTLGLAIFYVFFVDKKK